MKKRVLLAIVFYVGFGLSGTAFAAEPPAEEPVPATAPQKCLIAEVNPVTGSVYCIKPLGAPVDPPPTADAPCTQDPRMKGQWTWGPNCKP